MLRSARLLQQSPLLTAACRMSVRSLAATWSSSSSSLSSSSLLQQREWQRIRKTEDLTHSSYSVITTRAFWSQQQEASQTRTGFRSLSTKAATEATNSTTSDSKTDDTKAAEPNKVDENATLHSQNSTAEEGKEEKKPSFEEMVRRMKKKKGDGDDSLGSAINTNEWFRRAADIFSNVSEEVGKTWHELIQSGQRKQINKKIHPVATDEGETPYTGPVEIMVIDPSENLTAWERMQKRLADAPLIQGMLQRSEEYFEKSGAKKVKERVDHIREDAREAWETSQNPWVYRISSVYDTLTAETPESIAVKELRILDPAFTLDDWRRDVVEHDLPQIMSWFLEGKINQLKPWLGEGVFRRIAAEITARKQEGVQIDTHVLGIMNSEILAIEPDEVNKGSPIIVLHFMVQQINCVRKKEDGTVVEGSEDDIRANSYVAAFQREYNEEKGELNWKIVDFRFNGAIAYL